MYPITEYGYYSENTLDITKSILTKSMETDVVPISADTLKVYQYDQSGDVVISALSGDYI
jgi:hypothetical protein